MGYINRYYHQRVSVHP